MGQMIDEEDCEVCKPFDQEWIFTYGDLVTLLFCFFVLLVSLCKTDVEKIKQISASFKENPPGSPLSLAARVPTWIRQLNSWRNWMYRTMWKSMPLIRGWK